MDTNIKWSRNWSPQAKEFLTRIIADGAGQRLPVVFDFDNTIICGDIGEATFAILVRDRLLRAENISPTLSPDFLSPSGESIGLRSDADLIRYYEALQTPTSHRTGGGSTAQDPAPFSTAYVWVAQIMAGLSPFEIVEATAKALALSQPGRLVPIEITSVHPGYPAPYFCPESVELIAELLRNEFEVWICSASNVWTVRWMVLHGLNPLLRSRGLSHGVAPDKVIGISLLLQDSGGRLYKDRLLVQEDPDYANLEAETLRALKLTSTLHQPVPTASGKVASIWEQIGRAPFLSIGDSPGDLPMLTFSSHRLWLARPDKPAYQAQVTSAMAATGEKNWCIQPLG